jgi:hypothetical protein
MRRAVLVVACLAAGLTLAMTSAGAAPGGTVPVGGSGPELSFSGTLTLTGFTAVDKQVALQGILNGPLTSSGGVAVDVSDLPVELPLDSLTATCEPPEVRVVSAATAVPIVGFDPVTLDSLALRRPVDPADTALVDQVCAAAGELQDHGKLKGRRLADAVDALNALGGTWEAAGS